MSLLDSLQQRYSERNELVRVELEGIEPFWFQPVYSITPVQRSKLDKLHANLSMDNAADVLVFRARNEDGTKMFNGNDVEKIKSLTLSTDLESMIQEMIRIDAEGEQEKKDC